MHIFFLIRPLKTPGQYDRNILNCPRPGFRLDYANDNSVGAQWDKNGKIVKITNIFAKLNVFSILVIHSISFSQDTGGPRSFSADSVQC